MGHSCGPCGWKYVTGNQESKGENLMTTKLTITIGAVVVASMAVSAIAETITYQREHSWPTTYQREHSWPTVTIWSEDQDHSDPGWDPTTLALPKFIPAQHSWTLEKIEIVLVGIGEGCLMARNMVWDLGSELSGQLGAHLTLELPDTTLIEVSPLAEVGSNPVSHWVSGDGYDGADAHKWGCLAPTDAAAPVWLIEGTDDLTPFIGTSAGEEISLTITAESLTSAWGSAGLTWWKATDFSTTMTVTITYHYTPEPTSLGLLALGSLVMTRNRRR